MTTPSPRPAALVAAVAKAICDDAGEWAMWAVDYADDPEPFLAYAEAALKAIADQGLVLVPRAELEEAARVLGTAALYIEKLTDSPLSLQDHMNDGLPHMRESEAKLRQRSRG